MSQDALVLRAWTLWITGRKHARMRYGRWKTLWITLKFFPRYPPVALPIEISTHGAQRFHGADVDDSVAFAE